MAITKTNFDYKTGTSHPETYFAGRVIEVLKVTETRNWSDTLDYSDYRSTDCTYALVWLGTHNFPSESRRDRKMASYYTMVPEGYPTYGAARELEFWEQFVWVDCTNLFSDRNGFSLKAEVDVTPTDGTEPLLWANYHAWKAYEVAAAEKAMAEIRARAAVQAAEKAKKVAAAAKRQAEEDALKEAAALRLAKAPAKGTTVTVDGFTGRCFYRGVNKYRGSYRASYGIKDSRGTVKWVEVPA